MDISFYLDNGNDNVLNRDGISFYHADITMHFLGRKIQRNSDAFVFRYTISDENGIVKEFDGDLNNIYKVLSRWNGLHVTDRVSDLFPNTDYVLNISADYDGNPVDFSVQFTTTLPPKQYNSWIWNDITLEWDPPSAYPNDGLDYTWNEDSLVWDLVEQEEVISSETS